MCTQVSKVNTLCDYSIRKFKTLKLNPKDHGGNNVLDHGCEVVTEFSHSQFKSLLFKFHSVCFRVP